MTMLLKRIHPFFYFHRRCVTVLMFWLLYLIIESMTVMKVECFSGSTQVCYQSRQQGD